MFTNTYLDGLGNYTVHGLPPGMYYLKCSGYGDYVSEWLASPSSQFACSGAQPVDVTGEEVLTDMNFQLDQAAAISGTAFQSDGETPITEMQIVISAFSGDPCISPQEVAQSYTDYIAGSYTISGLPEGSYFLRSSNNGTPYINEWWADPDSVPGCDGAQSVFVSTGGAATGKNFQLDTGATISGTVYNSGGSPILGQYINVDVYTGDPCNDPTYVTGVQIDPYTGTYTVTGLVGGTYYLQTCNNGAPYLNEWWNSSSAEGQGR